jgi:hypothetical protein
MPRFVRSPRAPRRGLYVVRVDKQAQRRWLGFRALMALIVLIAVALVLVL